uniref:Repulsive guidance molecule C-terminal domain-containing protein n=1 Tax=Meloidogyne hapla TaxID=6305 RepID=A0A1I8B7R3_MELHA
MELFFITLQWGSALGRDFIFPVGSKKKPNRNFSISGTGLKNNKTTLSVSDYKFGYTTIDEYDEYENNIYDGDQLDEEGDEKEHIVIADYDKNRKCAIFGHLNLLRFHSDMPENCAITGAHPLFDSRFLLIQVTIDKLNEKVNGRNEQFISKVAVIVRPREGCVPTQKIYLADASDPGPVSGTFDDGTNEIGEQFNKRGVKIFVLEEGIRADIILYHLATIVRIRKFGNKFLSVFIDASKRLLDNQHDYFQICTGGCRQIGRKEFNEINKIEEQCWPEINEITGK